MVRLKQRYILFEILYPPSDLDSLDLQDDLFETYNLSPDDTLLTLHRTSPAYINPKSLIKIVRRVIQDHFGDVGAGTAGLSISIRYFSNRTSTGIIRCSRQYFEIVRTALTLINVIHDKNVIIRCPHVSGTIKKCENFSIERTKKLMRYFENKDSLKVTSLISSFADPAIDPSDRISDID